MSKQKFEAVRSQKCKRFFGCLPDLSEIWYIGSGLEVDITPCNLIQGHIYKAFRVRNSPIFKVCLHHIGVSKWLASHDFELHWYTTL